MDRIKVITKRIIVLRKELDKLLTTEKRKRTNEKCKMRGRVRCLSCAFYFKKRLFHNMVCGTIMGLHLHYTCPKRQLEVVPVLPRKCCFYKVKKKR